MLIYEIIERIDDLIAFLSYLTTPFNFTSYYALKLIISLFFLIFIRAGLPRYRYDYLTKLGWIKFLLLSVFSVFFIYSFLALFF